MSHTINGLWDQHSCVSIRSMTPQKQAGINYQPTTCHKAHPNPLDDNTRLGKPEYMWAASVTNGCFFYSKYTTQLVNLYTKWQSPKDGELQTFTTKESTTCNLRLPSLREPLTCDFPTRSHRAYRSDHCWMGPSSDQVEWPQTRGTWRCGWA